MSQEQRIALVTGANKGIGLEIARQLGREGLTVLMGAREKTRGEAAAAQLAAQGLNAHFVQLDVTCQPDIDAAAALIERTYGRLDVLVNNAGVSGAEPGHVLPSQLELDVLRGIFETNFFGAFAMIRAMLPLLRKSAAGRIVNVSSTMGSLTIHSDPASYMYTVPPLLAYCSSKTAMNGLTVFFARELKDTAITINSICPGYVATDLNNFQGYLTPEQGAALPVRYALMLEDSPSGAFFGSEGEAPW